MTMSIAASIGRRPRLKLLGNRCPVTLNRIAWGTQVRSNVTTTKASNSKATSHTFSADKEFTQTTLASEFWQSFCALDNSPRLGVIYISLGSSDFSGQKGLFWQQKSNKQKALDDALLKLQNKYGSGLI